MRLYRFRRSRQKLRCKLFLALKEFPGSEVAQVESDFLDLKVLPFSPSTAHGALCLY